MRKVVIILAAISFLTACNSPKTPDHVIPKDIMIDIIVDIHMTDAMMTITEIRKGIMEEYSNNIYDQILSQHGYSRHDFDTSVYYYSFDINQYDEIYKEVLNVLSERDALIKEEGAKTEEDTVIVER
jgi:hypothetical protein